MKEVVTDSEAFKRGVVEKTEAGVYNSLREAGRKNGVCVGTVVKWVKKYGREDILPKRVKVVTMKEVDEMKTARKRIRELEAALADAHIDWLLESIFFK